MNFVYDLLFIIFSFSLGGITFLFLIFFFITTFMKILSLKCNEIKQRTKLTNPKRKSKYGKMQEIDVTLPLKYFHFNKYSLLTTQKNYYHLPNGEIIE